MDGEPDRGEDKGQELTFGDFKIVAAIKQVSSSPVADQVTRLPVDGPIRKKACRSSPR